ncbi:MAG: EI24 domain-containing protein [Flavobacteriales bacterium]|jgi:CysZ protein|nr:EI24 domain-containing protein [Flavobacteriales bacterium]
MRDLGLGLNGFISAFRFTLRNGMGWMFLVPIVLWVALFYGFFHAMEGMVEAASAQLAVWLELPVAQTSTGDWWEAFKAWMNGAREVIVRWILRLAIGYLLFVANKYIVLVLLSPLLAYASELAEEKLTGRQFPFSWRQLMKDALRGALVAMRNGVLELAFTVAIWVASFFLPLITPISFILLFVVSSYFYGFSMFDYVFERRRMRIGETTRAVNSQLGAVLANGACFSLLMKIPLIGLMLAPVMASVGASITVLEREKQALMRNPPGGQQNPQAR